MSNQNNCLNQPFIDAIVEYANSAYQIPYAECITPNHNSSQQCEECLRRIHFDNEDSQSYLCGNSCYVYICKYVHKYASEAYQMFRSISLHKNPSILSLGCGPATELCAIEYLYDQFNYTGVDLNDNWGIIHQFYKENTPQNSTIDFVIEDANTFIEYSDLRAYNIIIMNYFLSDMVKFQSKAIAREFLQKLKAKFADLNHYPIILYNDINLNYDNQNTGSLDIMLDELCRIPAYSPPILRCFKNQKAENSGKETFSYRNRFNVIDDNSLCFKIHRLSWKYNPYETTSAAQIILEM